MSAAEDVGHDVSTPSAKAAEPRKSRRGRQGAANDSRPPRGGATSKGAAEPDAERWAQDEEYVHTDADNLGPGRVFQIGDHVDLARALVTDLGGAEDIVHDELHTWRYEATGGLWTKIEPALKSRIVQSYSGSPKLPNYSALKIKASDVAGAIKLANDQIARPGFFASSNALVFSNRVVRLRPAAPGESAGLEILPHGRDHRARAGYPFAFESKALPRHFLEFLHGLFRDDADSAEKVNLVQEFFGACILGIAPRYQRACIAIGEGENGKSTLAEIVTACMPEGTTSSVAPQDWGQEYRRALLVGKHLNAVSELPEREIIASETFKAIVTGDPVVAREIRESPVEFRPRAGHYFAANRLPGTTDQSEGFWRRFVVLTFNRSFKNDPDKDPDMGAKLKGERPAIVSWLLSGVERLVNERAYTLPASHHAALAEWRKNADQVALFVESELRQLDASEDLTAYGTSGASLYAIYATWCGNNGHRALASNRFAERMKGLGIGATHTKRGNLYPVARRGEGLVKGGEGSPFTPNAWAS